MPMYVPETDELTDAISGYLKEQPDSKTTASAKDIAKTLEEENPTWKVQEKKVAKILKKKQKKKGAKSAEGTNISDEASVSSSYTASSRARKVLSKAGKSMRRVVSSKKSKKGSVISAPEVISEISKETNLLPAMDDEPEAIPESAPESAPEPDKLDGEDIVPETQESEGQKPCFGLCTIS